MITGFKLMVLWAYNEDLSMKILDKQLLELTQNSLLNRSNRYLYSIMEGQCGKDIANKYSNILTTMDFEEFTSDTAKIVKKDINGYCISCGSPLFKEINYDHYVDGYCKLCHMENVDFKEYDCL